MQKAVAAASAVDSVDAPPARLVTGVMSIHRAAADMCHSWNVDLKLQNKKVAAGENGFAYVCAPSVPPAWKPVVGILCALESALGVALPIPLVTIFANVIMKGAPLTGDAVMHELTRVYSVRDKPPTVAFGVVAAALVACEAHDGVTLTSCTGKSAKTPHPSPALGGAGPRGRGRLAGRHRKHRLRDQRGS